MRVLFALGLAACAGPAAPPPTPSPPPVAIEAPPVRATPRDELVVETRRVDRVQPAERYLGGGAHDRRARVAVYGPLYASEPDGQPPLNEDLSPEERAEAWEHEIVDVVEERPTSLRVVIEDEGVRVVAYLPRGDLRPVVRRRAPASLGARRAPRASAGVWLRPGSIATTERTGDLTQVAIDEPIWVGTAWIAHEAVDVVFEPEPEPDPEASDEDEPHVGLPAGTSITTEDGELLLATRQEIVVTKLETAGGRARVRYDGDRLVVEGWVPLESLGEEGFHGFGGSGGGGWGTSGPTRHLHAGDRLHAPGGEVVAVVLAERLLARDDGDRDGGRGVGVRLGGWSFLSLWITAEDAARGAEWERVYHQRVRIEPVAGGPPLPSSIAYKQSHAASCWEEAMPRKPEALSLRLTWSTGSRVAVPKTPPMDAKLHECLDQAFSRIFHHGPPPALPLAFMLHLEPTPLPERPGAP